MNSEPLSTVCSFFDLANRPSAIENSVLRTAGPQRQDYIVTVLSQDDILTTENASLALSQDNAQVETGRGEEDVDEETLDILLKALCALTDEAAAQLGASKKKNGQMTKNVLTQLATKLSIPKNKNKPELIQAIRQAYAHKEQLITLTGTDEASSVSAIADVSIYRKDKNTIPRIVNIAFENPEGLQRTTRTASRDDLQDRSLYGNSDFWKDVADKFNNPRFFSGSIVCSHDIFDLRHINPEALADKGKLLSFSMKL